MHLKGLLQRPELTLYLRIWHRLRHKHTWPLLGLLTRVLASSLKFFSWEACDPSKSPKDARQREMVLPDLERGLLGPQRWTSCGEENILSWIRGMFVYQGRCAAPSRGEYWESKRKMYQQLCNIHKIWKGLEAAMYSIVSKSWIFNLVWTESCSKLDLPYSYQRFFKRLYFVNQTHMEQKMQLHI